VEIDRILKNYSQPFKSSSKSFFVQIEFFLVHIYNFINILNYYFGDQSPPNAFNLNLLYLNNNRISNKYIIFYDETRIIYSGNPNMWGYIDISVII